MTPAQEIIAECSHIKEILRIREIMKEIDPNVCLQCYKCIGTCTAAQIYESFRPAKIVRYVSLGMISPLIAGKEIWLCVQCLRCVDICSMKVKPAEVIITLRNLASKYHKLPTVSWERLIHNIRKIGGISKEVEQFAWRKTPVKRQDIGLAPLKFLSEEKIRVMLEASDEI